MWWKSNKIGMFAFYVLICLDALCVAYIFPLVPGFAITVTLTQAFSLTAISAVVTGLVLGFAAGSREKRAADAVDKLYITTGPLTNALLLMFWTVLFPSLGFFSLWHALIAGMMLHVIDIAVVRPWTTFIRSPA